jgi:hypothetical protein
MRSFVFGLALVAASTPALAVEKGVDDLLRVTSASAAIIQFCAPRYSVDEALAMNLGKAASEATYQGILLRLRYHYPPSKTHAAGGSPRPFAFELSYWGAR